MKNRIKKVYKYGTGQEIPEGAVYLCTKIEMRNREGFNDNDTNKTRYVWHYFLVEVKD